MAEIRFVAIQLQAVLQWMKTGRLTAADLDACLFVLPGESAGALAAIPGWANDFLGPDRGPTVARTLTAALAQAKDERRLLWRRVEDKIAQSIDTLGGAHGLVNIIQLATRAQEEKDELKPSEFRAKYGSFSPYSSMTSRNMEAALRTKHPTIRIVY